MLLAAKSEVKFAAGMLDAAGNADDAEALLDIEAAPAGEAGNGFSVVADEVKDSPIK